jgi:hypothetical protein
MNLKLQKISGVVYVGNYMYCTPGRSPDAVGEILSFNINRARGNPVSTLQVSVLAHLDFASPGTSVSNNLGERVIVKAGTGDSLDALPTLFTGYLVNVKKRPSLSDARKIILDISAEDEFAKIKYGGKFTRRIKVKDNAFAVITSGQRRQDGNLSLLKRIPPGHKGISFVSADSSGMENSPLIKTPDFKHYSPNGTLSRTSSGRQDLQEGTSIVAEPKSVVAGAGNRISVVIRDQVTGSLLDLGNCQDMSGTGCLCHMTPAPTYFSGSNTGGQTGFKPGVQTYPVMYDVDRTNNAFIFTITGDTYPAKVTFVHPKTGATCSIEFTVIPMHTHRDAGSGGTAVGSFDSFIV